MPGKSRSTNVKNSSPKVRKIRQLEVEKADVAGVHRVTGLESEARPRLHLDSPIPIRMIDLVDQIRIRMKRQIWLTTVASTRKPDLIVMTAIEKIQTGRKIDRQRNQDDDGVGDADNVKGSATILQNKEPSPIRMLLSTLTATIRIRNLGQRDGPDAPVVVEEEAGHETETTNLRIASKTWKHPVNEILGLPLA